MTSDIFFKYSTQQTELHLAGIDEYNATEKYFTVSIEWNVGDISNYIFSGPRVFRKTKFDRCSTDLAPRIDGTGRREDHLYNMQKNLEYRSRQMDKNKQETRKKSEKAN